MDTRDPWPRHSLRPVTCLDGIWSFRWLGDGDPTRLPEPGPGVEPMAVPWAFDASPAHAGRRGVALYETELTIPAGHPSHLAFGAVSMWCSVWVDGVHLLNHGGGFTPFQVEVPPSSTEKRRLQVLVDNRFNLERNILHDTFYDFYQWGGITRSVFLHVTPALHLKRVHVIPLEPAKGRIKAQITLSQGFTGDLALHLSMDGGEPLARTVAFVNGSGSLEVQVPDPKVWSCESPSLHRLRILMGTGADADDLEVRFGLRTIRVSGRDILLNDRPVKLLGYNRHESHPHFGPSLPLSLMLTDLHHLKALGCNFIRGCHYPQDQRFLDLCDEMGFLVWEESLGWQNTEFQLTSPVYRAEHLAMIRAMVETSFNHPSVILWGFLNEGPSDMAWARPAYEESAALLRSLDPSRPITFASHKPLTDLCFDLVDIVSQNLYPGWYGDNDVEDRLSLIAPRLKQVHAHLEKTGFGGKPYILSEIGAEGLYGWRDPLNNFYTEKFQADYIAEVIRLTVKDPKFNGLALWHFADARTYNGARAMTRPRAYNNKGTLDEYRRPKEAYGVVREGFMT